MKKFVLLLLCIFYSSPLWAAEAYMQIESDWRKGFVARVIVDNTDGDTTLENWQVEWSFDREIHHMWNATYKRKGEYIIVSPRNWNAIIPAGEVREFGFIGEPGKLEQIPEISIVGEGNNSENDRKLCARLNERRYYSLTLEEGGNSPDGELKRHWTIDFKDGVLSLSQSDFSISGKYRCEDGEVIVALDDDEQRLDFNSDLTDLYFHPFGGADLIYRLGPASIDTSSSCDLVDGKQYRTDRKDSPIDGLSFNRQRVEIDADGEKENGYFDCDLGTLHVHRSASDVRPILLKVEQDGERLQAKVDGKTVSLSVYEEPVTLSVYEEPVFCTANYLPVCAAEKFNIQCVRAPCPSEVYRTFGNACEAGVAKAKVLFDGICGDLEGKFVEAP